MIHATAIVDDGAEIGPSSRIWHWTHVCCGARIGESCSLGQNVYVGPGVAIGDGCKIQNNVSLYEGVTLEEDVFCGPSMVFTNVINPRSAVDRRRDFRPTLVRRGATIGANATILCGHTIGEHAFIAAGAVVSADVPDFALVAGVPAQQKGWISRHGERLNFKDSDEASCPATGERYRLADGRVSRVEG
jgi:UDP-2-acetamido-3-amino-2,3-dideoxy-glucuronate N-acetyltransferase